jgi:hypothetical protein
MHETIDRVTQEDWISRARHAEQLQEDFHKQIARDEVMQRITINLEDTNDDSELSDMESEQDDDSDKPL